MFNYIMVWSELHFWNDDGQGMVEYILILALIALAVIIAIAALGDQLTNSYNNVVDEMP